jgi:uncharacterized membrane protein
MSPIGHDGRESRREGTSANVRFGVSLGIGACAGGVALAVGVGSLALVIAWDIGALVYVVWTWQSIGNLDPDETKSHVRPNEADKPVADALLLGAIVVSLAAVAIVLFQAGNIRGSEQQTLVGLGVLSVVLGWATVHTVYTLRYAWLYYRVPEGGIDFKRDSPCYRDFAYLAFTIGMTFQVSDTDIETTPIRATALRHALLSYLFGAVIIATTINLIAGITR